MNFHFPLSGLIAGCATAMSLAAPASQAAQNQVAATIDKQEITVQELQMRTAAKVDAEQRQYELQLRQLSVNHERKRQEYQELELGALVDERVLALEAKARKTTPDALLAAAKAPEITDAQVHNFFDSRSAHINQPFESVAPQIKAYLQKSAAEAMHREYLEKLRAKYHVKIELEPLRTEVSLTGPERGPSDAPVTIVEFSDFQCPFCARFEPVVTSVMAAYPKQVRLVYRNFPLADLHPEAQKAAEAAQCARDQGKFWEMHDLLFAEQSLLSISALKEKAGRLGLDTKIFDACLDSGKSRGVIEADAHDGDQLAITGTPASFINGRFTNGAVTESELKNLVEDELRRVSQGVSH